MLSHTALKKFHAGFGFIFPQTFSPDTIELEIWILMNHRHMVENNSDKYSQKKDKFSFQDVANKLLYDTYPQLEHECIG